MPAAGEVVITTVAAGVNRADLAQRQGFYPPPPGAPPYPGLECSGHITAIGAGVTGWQLGDEACALLAGGGYAEQVAVPAGQLLPIPAGRQPARRRGPARGRLHCALQHRRLRPPCAPARRCSCMAARAASAPWLSRSAGRSARRVACTAGSADKLARCRELGAELTINYREQDFAAAVLDFTGGRGADVILDIMAAAYLQRNVTALRYRRQAGRHRHAGRRRAASSTSASSCASGPACRARRCARGRLAEKAAIVAAVRDELWPLIGAGQIRPVIQTVLPLEQAAEAHRLMDGGAHVGKILLATAAATAS